MLYDMKTVITLNIGRFDFWTWFAHSRWRYTALGFHWRVKIMGNDNDVLIGFRFVFGHLFAFCNCQGVVGFT